MVEYFVVLHNVTGMQRLIEFVKTAFNFNDIRHVIVTKVGGTAAQAGIPEISKLAFKLNRSLIILPDLKDAIELFTPDDVYLISQYATEEINVEDIKNKKRVMFVISGIESDFSSVEKGLGNYVKISNLNKEASPIALLTALFYCILK